MINTAWKIAVSFGRRLLLCLMLTILTMLCACHGKEQRISFDAPEGFDTSRNYEITFWAKNDTNITQTQIYKKAIEDFQKLYPNITVNLRLYTDYGKIYNDVITNIATNTTPNVCITYPDHIATYKTGENVVVPLDTLMENPSYGLGGKDLAFDGPTEEEIIAPFLKECVLDGTVYCLPFMRSSEVCYVNKDFVEQLGFSLPETLTWDFVWEVSEKAMEKNEDGLYKINQQNVLIPFIYKSTDNFMIQMLEQLDAPYSNEAGEILIFHDTTKELLSEIASHAKTGAFSTFRISSYPANFLNAGQCIFAIDSTAGATWMGSNAPLSDISEDSIVPFETEVMLLPQFNPDKPKMISQGPSVCIFNKEDPNEVVASWLFTQYLLTNQVQIAYASTEGYIPVTSKAQQDPEYLDYLNRCGQDNDMYYDVKIKASRLLLEHTQDTFVTPVFNGSASLRNGAGQLIENVTKSVRRKQTIDEAYYEKMFQEVISLYHLDQTSALSQFRKDLGPLPTTARLFLGFIAVMWIGIILSIFTGIFKKSHKNQE